MNIPRGRPKAFGVFSLLFLLLLSLFSSPGFGQPPAIRIRAIEVRGQRRVEESTIRFYISARVGDEFSVSQLRADIKKIYDLGFFRDVKVDVEPFEGGLRVVFVVEEKPAVAAVRIAGNVKIEEAELRAKVTVAVQSIVNPATIRESVQNLRALYQEKGYYFAQVESIVEETAANQVNVEFRITEGDKVSIAQIRFEGNRAFTEKQLKGELQTGERWFLSWITGSDIYKEDQVRTDILRLQVFYQNQGYLRVEVGEPRLEEDRAKNELRMVIPIREGEQYRVGSLRAEGDDIFTAEEIQGQLTLKAGEVYDRSRLQADIVKLTELYAEKGHAFADIIPFTRVDDAERQVHIVVTPRKGRRVFIGRVFIRGNDFTRDKVVRREVKLEEGALFDGTKLRETRRRINNLGFFEEVKIETKRGATEDLLDVHVELKEKPTGVIAGGLGYSSRAKGMVFGEIREANLFGRGQSLSFRIRTSAIDTSGELSFVEPHFWDTDFALLTAVFAQTEEFDTFKRERQGANLGFGRAFGEYYFARLQYQYEINNVFNVDELADPLILAQKGESSTSSIFPTLIRDTQDNRFRPTQGGVSGLRGQLAGGPLGADNNFYRFFLAHRQYYPVWTDRVIAMGHGQIGYADGFGGKELPAFERLFLGGARTVRGFDFREIGPKDAEGRPIGGHASLLFNFELQFPFIAGLRAVTFFDAGQVYLRHGVFDPTELRTSVGAGLRILSPLGPISMDWGFKLDRKPGEGASEFHFSIGQLF